MQIRVVAGVMIAVAASSSSVSGVIEAQALVQESMSVAMAVPQASSGLSAKVSLNLQGATLDQAIHAIARQADLKVTLGEDVFRTSRRVTLQATGLSAKDALEQVIAGTGISMSTVSSDQVVFVKGTSARADGAITGKIINAKTKQPMSGVTVTLGEAGKGVTTGADGTFRLVAPAGDQTVYIRSVGFVRQQRKVSVPEGQNISLDVALEPSASVLDEVVVTGTVVATERKAIATPITVITAEELEKRGITRIEQLFRGEVPGLLVLDQGAYSYSNSRLGQGVSSEIFARGAAGLTFNDRANPIKTYVDGVELLDPSYLGTIDPQSIEKIEIVVGPQAATIYGSGAMGGVMQIFTKKGGRDAMPEIRIGVKYGVLQNNYSKGKTPKHQDALTLTGGSGPEFTYSGNLSFDYTGQWQPKLYNGRVGAALGITHTRDRLTASASISTSASRQGTWSTSYTSDYGILHLLTSPDAIGGENMAVRFYSDRVSTSSNQTVSLNATYRVSDAWSHGITIGRSQNVMAMRPAAPEFASGPSQGGVGADTLFQTMRANGQRLTWNYNTSYASSLPWISSSLTLGANGSSGEQLAVSGGLVSAVSSTIIGWRADAAPSVTLPLNTQSWGGFGNWRIGLFGRLYTTFGLRVEQNPNYGQKVKFDFTPTNGLTYTIDYGEISLKLMGSYGRATRPPAPDQRLERVVGLDGYDIGSYVYRFANPELRPEYSRGPQAGFELYLGNRGSLTVNHYSQHVTDLIQQIWIDSIQITQLSDDQKWWLLQGQFQNVAKIRQMGWEGTASANIGPMTFKGAYSWSASKLMELYDANQKSIVNANTSFADLPTHSSNVTVGYARGQTSVALVTNIMGATHSSRNTYQYQATRFARLRGYTDVAYQRYARVYGGVRKVPGYAKSDFSGSQRISSQLTVMLNIVNIGNSFTSDLSEFSPTLGRQTTLGFSYRFGSR